MGGAIAYTTCSLFFSILLVVVYFSKKRLKSIENKIYSYLIIINLLGLIIHISCGIFTPMEDGEFLSILFSKLYCIYLLVWVILFTLYIFIISTKKLYNSMNEKGKGKAYYNIVWTSFGLVLAVSAFLIATLKLSIYNKDGAVYTYGNSVDFLYIISVICMLVMVTLMLYNFKEIKQKKYLPIFIYMGISGAVVIIQSMHPELLLMTAMETFITFLMYFTIENPDMKMIAQLDAARAAAEKANRAKSDFLSSMSHEIRTPLNAIVGFSDCILEETTLDAAMSDAKDIKLASQNLLEIVNGILDISKIEANKMEIVNTEYELKDTLMNIAKLVKPRIGDKPIELIENYASDLPYKCYGDGGKLRQIVTNILTNAVKYTETGSIKYNVACINEGDTCKLCISVEDTGRGIKPEQIDKLFTKFQRLDEDKNTTLEGTGLGLAITKNLAEMMGGKVVVQSVYGQGSKFTVYLSQKIVELVHTEESLMNDINKMNKMNSTVDFSTKKVLVVDDNKINIKVALKLLSQYGITADSAESGQEAIDKIKASTYDLVMLDDMMPHMSGVETLHNLKTIPTYATPTVALTANALTGMKEKYLNDGFTDYLAKPIEKPELERVLNEYLK